jgi:hypothetical protein
MKRIVHRIIRRDLNKIEQISLEVLQQHKEENTRSYITVERKELNPLSRIL